MKDEQLWEQAQKMREEAKLEIKRQVSASNLTYLLSADFSLERLIAARKMRTHCRKYTVDELLDEIVALYNKYYLPDIEKLKDAAGR